MMRRVTGRLGIASALTLVVLAVSAAPVTAQKITVKSATPNNGAQGTVDLDVVIGGNGFGQGSKAEFFLSGTQNPDGIHVKNTRFVSSSQLVATIDIADAASLALFDIKVSINGRSGKGTDLFQVVQKQACTDPPQLLAPDVIDVPLPVAGPTCQPGVSGSLDCTFGNAGRVMTTTLLNGTAWGVAHQPDGKLIVMATGTPPTGSSPSGVFVLRYTAAGVVDTTFATNGIRYLDYISDRTVHASALALQADGKIVIGTTAFVRAGGLSVAAITRLTPTGNVDSTFGTRGLVMFSYGASNKSSTVSDLSIQSDGRILVNGGNGVARLLPSGALDPSFGTNGRLVLAAGSREGELTLNALELQSVDGAQRLLLAGGNTACDGTGQMVIVRLLGNGALDTSFGPRGDGRVQLRFFASSLANNAEGARIDSLGRIVVTGWGSRTEGGIVVARVGAVRLLPDGQVDVSYGNDGAVLVGVSGRNSVSETRPALDASGRLILAGWQQTRSGTGPSDGGFLVARLLDSGQLDPTFGSGGIAVTDFSPMLDFGIGLALDPIGRIVQVGKVGSPSAMGLLRYVP